MGRDAALALRAAVLCALSAGFSDAFLSRPGALGWRHRQAYRALTAERPGAVLQMSIR